jgi:hypothetical protein
MVFGSKRKQSAVGESEPVAHEVWTHRVFEKITKTKQFEVDILEITKTISTIGRDRGAGGITIEITDALLVNILRPPVRAGIHFNADNHVTLDDGSTFTAKRGVGYYWLHSGVASDTGEQVPRKLRGLPQDVAADNPTCYRVQHLC